LTDSEYGRLLSFFSPWKRETSTCTFSGMAGAVAGGFGAAGAGFSWLRTMTDEASANANTSAIVCTYFVTGVLLLRRPG
jgi:hypothetical protein